MAMIPAICDSCGAMWGAEGIFGGPGAMRATLTGNKVGPCPNCGGMGSIPDGVYDIQNNTLKVIQASGTSTETLQSLIRLLESLRRGEASSSQVIDRVEQEAPALAPTVRSALGKSDPAKWIALLIAIFSLYLQTTAAQPPSAEEVAEAIREKSISTFSVPSPAANPNPATPPPTEKTKKRKPKKKRAPKTYGTGKERKSQNRR
jgi:hypothetical protein